MSSGSCKLGGRDTGILVLLPILEHFSVPVLLEQYRKTSIVRWVKPIPIFDNTGKPVLFRARYWTILGFLQYWNFLISQYFPVFSSIVENNNTGIQYRPVLSSIVFDYTDTGIPVL